MGRKAYLAKLDRFGYELTAIGRTKGEAHDAVIESYISAYRSSNNGSDPATDLVPYSEKSYLDLANDEMFVTPINYGEVMWL